MKVFQVRSSRVIQAISCLVSAVQIKSSKKLKSAQSGQLKFGQSRPSQVRTTTIKFGHVSIVRLTSSSRLSSLSSSTSSHRCCSKSSCRSSSSMFSSSIREVWNNSSSRLQLAAAAHRSSSRLQPAAASHCSIRPQPAAAS